MGARGGERQVDRAHFIVHFEGDKVSRIEKPDLPEPLPVDNKAGAPEGKEPPPLPSVQQRQPDAPRPGGSGNN